MSESMVCLRFLFVLLAGVVCSFWGNDFVSLGRHAWRCEQRITPAERPSARVDEDANESVAADASSRVCLVRCCCGRLCKGNRGLKMHQRSCRVVLGLNDQLRADLNDAVLTDQESGDVGDLLMASGVPSPQPENHCFHDIKKGINLPKSEDQWLTADEYFKSVLSMNPPITVQNLSSCVKRPVSIKHGLRTADYGLWTGYKIRTRYKTRTGKYGLGMKHGLSIKRGLRTADCGLGKKCGLLTTLVKTVLIGSR